MEEKNGNKGDYREFREMLRKGIGSRGQKEFAEAVGISPSHLNRMLNNDEIPRPSRRTLAKITKHINNVTLNDFLEACGYPAMTVEERVEKLEKDISDGISCLKGRLLGSMEDMFQALESQYVEEAGWFKTDGDEKDADSKDAELCVPVSFCWNARPYSCTTPFTLFFARTLKGRVIPVSMALKEPETAMEKKEAGTSRKKTILHTTVIEDRPASRKSWRGGTAEERLLEAVFGGTEFEPSVLVGYGLRYGETPEGFMDFMYSHGGSFATGMDEAALYQKSLLPGADADDTYGGYSYGGGACGTGSVVAKILEMETGMPFRFYDSRMEDDAGNIRGDAFVMTETTDRGEKDVPEDIVRTLLAYAKELKVPEFGMCYHHIRVGKRPSQIFKTDDLYLQFN